MIRQLLQLERLVNTVLQQPFNPAFRPRRGQSDVVAGLHYLSPTSVRPYSYAYEPPPGTPWESGEYELRQVSIADRRSAITPCSINRDGFELWDAPTAVRDFFSEDEVRNIYYKEAAELALIATGAQHAYVFDHLVRRRESDRAPLSFGRTGGGRVAANGRIHNDYTEESGRRRLALALPDLEAAARVRRYAIVNVWRSINGPVLDTPLAVCDSRTVTASDLVASEVRYPQRVGEIYHAVHSPLHRWSYYSEMDRHEALVFKQFDSNVTRAARFVLHAAFDLPFIPAHAPLRESIELRCLVVYE
jgi:hypothetical protein